MYVKMEGDMVDVCVVCDFAEHMVGDGGTADRFIILAREMYTFFGKRYVVRYDVAPRVSTDIQLVIWDDVFV